MSGCGWRPAVFHAGFGVILCWLLLAASFCNAQNLNFGPELNDTWSDPAVAGQGFFITASADLQLVFVAWTTFTPDADDSAAGQRWYTLLGETDGPLAELTIRQTLGGVIDNPATTTTIAVGQATLQFSDCNHGLLTYQFDDPPQSGSIAIQRLVSVAESRCDSLRPPQPVPMSAPADEVIVIQQVNLLPMTAGNGLLSGQSVVIAEGLIQQVGPSDQVAIPDGAVVIDGRQRYLMPGIIDTHTHLGTSPTELLGFLDASVTNTVATQELMLYLAGGVTTILNNGDFGEALPQWSRQVANQEKTGPTIFAAMYARGGAGTADGGPANRTVGGADQARAFTLSALQAGYRLMKLYNATPRSAALAILEESQRFGMPVIGHFPQTMSAAEAINNGLAGVAHSAAFMWRMFPDLNVARIPEATQLVLDHDVVISSTLWIETQIAQFWGGNPAGRNAYWARPEIIYMHPLTRQLNARSIDGRRWNPPGATIGGYQSQLNFVRLLVSAMHQAGARLMLGTDSPTVLGVPGFSAHDEMAALAAAGIDHLDVLRIATRNGGEFLTAALDLAAPLGVIRPGARADLVLLAANPLTAIANTRSIEGVMHGGHWRSSAWFAPQLAQIAAANQP
ncbi:MAG: hypothetical protein Tsb002_16820 [Wenzhouxiangellaceae bacterium]